jgi:hypothetical protein
MLKGYAFLDKNTPVENVVLASTDAANHILVYSHNYVLGNKQGWPAGEGATMIAEKDAFLRGMPESQAREYVAKHHISYVYGGYQEQGDYIHYPFLSPVFKNSEVTIYKVNL